MNNDIDPEYAQLTLSGAPELDVVSGAEKLLASHDSTSLFRRAGRILLAGFDQLRNENGGTLGGTNEITHEQLNNLIGIEPNEMTREASRTLCAVIVNADDISKRFEDGSRGFSVLSPSKTLYLVRERIKKQSVAGTKLMIGAFPDFEPNMEDLADEPLVMTDATDKYIFKYNRERGLHLLDRQTKQVQRSNTILNLAIELWDGIALERRRVQAMIEELNVHQPDIE